MVIYTRASEAANIPTDTGDIPACISSHTLTDLLPLTGGTPVPFSHCSGHKVLAFAGIADPASFFAGLRAKGLNLVQSISFPDHVVYSRERCDEIAAAMRASGADFLVTTEKDGVKLKGFSAEYAARTLLARLDLTFDNPGRLKEMLTKLLNQQTQPPPTPPL